MSDLVGAGAERELVALLHHLPRDRFDIHLCLWRGVYDYSPPDDIPVTILDKNRPWHVFRTRRRFARLVEKLKPDLVYSQLNYVNTVTGSALGLVSNPPPWICRLAGNPEVEIRFPVLPWARRVFSRAQCVACCSNGTAEAAIRHLRLSPQKVRLLPNVVDVDAIERQSNEPSPHHRRPGAALFIHAGRMTAQKNQSLLLNAFARLGGIDAELWILGEGSLRPRLESQANQLGIADRVKWLGFQRNPFSVYRKADAFVLSSNYEGLPNVVIESMICGTPVVSTDCPFGPRELIDNEHTGILVPMRDAGLLAAAMRRFVEDPKLGQRLGVSARETILQRFHPDRILHEYVDLFEELGVQRTR